MIGTKDQEELFRLIADYLDRDLVCVAIGGTAMMFSGYKNATKDIDLVFASEGERKAFVRAIEQLGYRQRGLMDVYTQERRKKEGKPQLYARGEERFDLFVRSVFGFPIATKEIVERRDFLGKKELLIRILPKEDLILLKAVTGREKDFEDIEALTGSGKDVDWERVVEQAIRGKKGNEWILLDLEQTMQRLRKKAFIPQKYFDRLYEAHE